MSQEDVERKELPDLTVQDLYLIQQHLRNLIQEVQD